MGAGRYHSRPAYGHHCQYIGYGGWRLSWTHDRYYAGSRLRYPHTGSRDTDEAGARRFCAKHGLPWQEVQNNG